MAGSFLLPIGRLADMYGGYLVFNVGMAWFVLWCLIGGFSTNYTMLICCRAMQGLGVAAHLPTGIMLFGLVYRPGPRKNRVFALYGAVCPIGFFLGMAIGGLAEETLSWRWYFWLGTLPSLVGCAVSFLAIPRRAIEAKATKIPMDWWGAVSIVSGLMLLVYSVTDSARATQGWKSPHIIATAMLGVILLGLATFVEGWVSKSPLIPRDIFAEKYMKRMILCLFIEYGVFGIYLFYSTF